MKYWVYKNSRILGPYDADSMVGVPGLDEATLVGVGESATDSSWRPAGEIAELESLALSQRAWSPRAAEEPMSYALLDNLQIETAGFIDDNDFPTIARTLFEDSGPVKKPFGGLMRATPAADALELARVQDRVSDLTQQLERLYQRVIEMQSAQAKFVLPPAETAKIDAAVLFPSAPQPTAASAPTPVVETPSSQPVPFVYAPIDQAAAAMTPAPAAPSVAPPPGAGPSPVVLPSAPMELVQVPIPPVAPSDATIPPPFDWVQEPLPAVGQEAPFAAADVASAPPAARRSFKDAVQKGFLKVVIPVQGLRLAEPAITMPIEEVKPVDAPAVAATAPAPAIEETPPGRIIPEPAPRPAPKPREDATPVALLARPAVEIPAPAATSNFGDKPATDLREPFPNEPELPSSWANFGAAAVETSAPAAAPRPAVPTRLAKPAPPPPTDKAPKARSSWTFLAGISAIVVLAGVFMVFLRQPKDFKPMTELDDGRSRIGAEPVPDGLTVPSAAPPMATNSVPTPVPTSPTTVPAAPPTAATPPEAPAALSKSDAAIATVKDYPLDGSRGTVGQWLQYSYTATPDAGQENWSASETSEKTYSVEYRFTPSARGATKVHYLFEVDMERGFVIGKNLDAKNMLGGVTPPTAAKPSPGSKRQKPSSRPSKPKRPAARVKKSERPGSVPLLPLPKDSELRAPAQDDGAFSTDTVNSDI